jgi:hypothetical protein
VGKQFGWETKLHAEFRWGNLLIKGHLVDQVDGSDPGSYPVADFGIRGAEHRVPK